jgi:hypothetical protein
MKVSRFLAALLLSLALVSGVLIFRPPGNFTASAANSVTLEVSTSGFAANESVRSAATEEDGPWANKLTQQQLELTDILLENPELSYGMRLVTQSTLAELGDVSMLMYRENTRFPDNWLYFRDTSIGEDSHLQPPDFPGLLGPYSAEHVLTSPNTLLMFYTARDSSGAFIDIRIDEFAPNGTPLPTSATRASSRSFGDSNSRAHSLIKLKSGGLLATWYQQNAKVDKSIDAGFAYRNPDGEWSTLFPVVIPSFEGGTISANRSTAVQHPAEGSIWAFFKRDSYHSLAVVRLTETSSSLELDWVNEGYISASGDGANGPESEFPVWNA